VQGDIIMGVITIISVIALAIDGAPRSAR